MINILKRGYSKVSPEVLVTIVGTILTALTGNAFFPSPMPTLPTLSAALQVLTDALNMPEGEAREQAIAAARLEIENLLEQLADDLENSVNNDLVKLATSGFDFNKTPAQTTDAPANPTGLRLKLTGIMGVVQVLFVAVARAKGYQIQWTLDPMAGPWIDVDPVASSRKVFLKDLPRAKDIWVRVRAIGPHNTMSGWSDPATILVN